MLRKHSKTKMKTKQIDIKQLYRTTVVLYVLY